MSQANPGGKPPLEAFRQAYLVANEAFNRHDFEAAFFGFAPDLEWSTVAEVPDQGVMRGRSAVIEGFRRLLVEFPDWRVDPEEFADVEDAILVRNVATGTGRTSGVSVRQHFTQVWQFRDGRPSQVREFWDHGEALEAVARRK